MNKVGHLVVGLDVSYVGIKLWISNTMFGS